jgi:cardiolipin synthase
VKRIGSILFLFIVIAAVMLVRQPRWFTDPRGTQSTPTVATSQSPLRAIVVLPEDGPGAILDELDSARTSIDLYVYLLPSEEILAALERAHDRDVTVRVILEKDPFGGGNSNQDSFDRLDAIGISVRWAPDRFQFSHIKMFVVDGTTAVIMTLNLSYSALNLNREFAVITTEAGDVTEARSLFAADWANEAITLNSPLVVSPDTSRAVLTDLIENASSSVAIYAEVVRDREVRTALIDAANRGVTVRVLVPESPSPDDATIYRELQRGGVQIRLLADVYSHAKAIVVDGTTAFVGSQNLTATSLDDNRELGIVLGEPANLSRLAGIFESDWETSPSF